MFFSKKKKKSVEANAAPVVASAAAPVAAAAPQDDSDEIAAVIAAVMAIVTAQAQVQGACVQEVIEGFHVRRIRRMPGVSQWGKAGREELLSSRNFN